MSETLHATRFPGESDEYRRERDRLLDARGATAAGDRVGRGGAARAAARRRGAGRLRLRSRAHVRALRAGQGHAGRSTASCSCRPNGDPLGVACPSCTSIIDSLDGAAPHIDAARQPRRRREGSARAVPRARARARLAQRPPALLGRARRTTATTTPRIRTPEDSSRSRRSSCAARGPIHHSWSSELMYAPREAGHAPAPRRFHVADLVGLRPDAGGPGHRLESASSSTPRSRT